MEGQLGGGGARLACGVVPAAVPGIPPAAIVALMALLLALGAHARRRGVPVADRG